MLLISSPFPCLIGRATLREWSLIFYGTSDSLDERPNSTTPPSSLSSSPISQRNPQRSSNPQKSIPGEKRKKGNNKGRNKTTTPAPPSNSTVLPATQAPPSLVTSIPARTTATPMKGIVKVQKTSTSLPRITTPGLPTVPPRVEILYPAGPLQFFPNSPVPSSMPNMTLVSSTASKQYPKVLLYPAYPRPKEGRQGSKRPDSPYFTSPFRPVNLLPSKGLDLRQDGQFDSRLLAAAGKGTHSSKCALLSILHSLSLTSIMHGAIA